MADDGAEQLAHIGFAVEEVGVLHQFFGPQLEAERVGRDDRADGQRPLRDENLGSLGFDLRGRFGLRRTASREHAARDECSTHRNDQRGNQQNQLLPIHGCLAP